MKTYDYTMSDANDETIKVFVTKESQEALAPAELEKLKKGLVGYTVLLMNPEASLSKKQGQIPQHPGFLKQRVRRSALAPYHHKVVAFDTSGGDIVEMAQKLKLEVISSKDFSFDRVIGSTQEQAFRYATP